MYRILCGVSAAVFFIALLALNRAESISVMKI